ncbi:MAG: hypothetical protein AAF517_10645 [Planctomycetota bacterium]
MQYPAHGGKMVTSRVGSLPGLNNSIDNVCAATFFAKPMANFSQKGAYGTTWPGGAVALFGGGGTAEGQPVTPQIAQKLLSALSSAKKNGDNSWGQVCAGTSVKTFRKMTRRQQLDVIDSIWNAAITSHDFSEPSEGMDDPLAKGHCFPTSWCPIEPGSQTREKRLTGSPWKDFSVGFRVDGQNESSLKRVLANGMTQQRANVPFMLGVRGLDVEETTAASAGAKFWTGNRDIFNESAICVSRNFYGGTAFPERDTNHSGSEYAILWAVDCRGLRGFDTEKHQLRLKGTNVWRPGEKSFGFIPKENLVAWVKIQRRGAPKGGGWRFDIAQDANWNFVGSPAVSQRTYIIDELNAWRGRHTIPPELDFA